MYAVVRTGGKQYRVAPGDVLKVEKLDGEAGQTILLQDVLLVADGETVTLGTPLVVGVVVKAEILEQTRTPKIIVFKKKRRHNYRRKRGHRQHVTVLKILEIGEKKARAGSGKKAAETEDAAKKSASAAQGKAKKTASAGKTASGRGGETKKASGEKKAAAAKKPAQKKSSAGTKTKSKAEGGAEE